MKVTITKKCPCGYMYKKQVEFDILTIPTTGIITRIPGKSPKVHNMPIKQQKIVNKSVLIGNQDFFNVLAEEDKDPEFIACPKCGTVLLARIATETEKEKD